ncbi:MAG: indole-3-glycerol phosphate synthase TrpC [Planctomycetaceae bacterium]|nr:indole-3-glycerol phosphate synthase TrpC [Planctomycetaceae bacterium]
MSVLDRIVENTRSVIAETRRRRPEAALRDALPHAAPVRDFVAALKGAARDNIAVIAEVKKASPSAGLIRADFDPVAIARAYEANGAACLSVLTDEKYFQGHLDYLRAVRAAVSIPVLRKDFIVDRYQVLEARAAGADCILLIAECLNDCEMRDLYFYASELGMECLIELYEPENLDRVLKLDPPLVGINNRNLKTMITDLDHSLRLREQIPESILLVSESGIKTRADVERLLEHNIRAILVGESLMKQADVGEALASLLSGAMRKE